LHTTAAVRADDDQVDALPLGKSDERRPGRLIPLHMVMKILVGHLVRVSLKDLPVTRSKLFLELIERNVRNLWCL